MIIILMNLSVVNENDDPGLPELGIDSDQPLALVRSEKSIVRVAFSGFRGRLQLVILDGSSQLAVGVQKVRQICLQQLAEIIATERVSICLGELHCSLQIPVL